MTAIEDIAARIGPSVVGLQDGSRGGSGVLVAPGVVVTLARNVHGDELTLVTGDGATHDATVLGIDPSVDLAVLRTGAPAPPAAWSTAADPAPARGEGLRARRPRRPRPARDLRERGQRPARRARPRRAPHPGCRRAHGAAAARRRGRPARRPLRRDRRPQRPAPRRRPPARLAGDGAARARRRAGRRRADRAAPPGHRPRRARGRPVACAPRWASIRSTACSCAACRRAARPTAPASPAATSWSAADGAAVTGLDDLHAAVDAAGRGALELEVLRGSERVTLRVEGEEVHA